MAQTIERIRFPALTSLGSRKAETAPEGTVSAVRTCVFLYFLNTLKVHSKCISRGTR